MKVMETHRIETVEQLLEVYGSPLDRSLAKELDHLSDHYIALINASPFVVIATVGPDGLDCSPRGDPAPVVAVEDAKTLYLPDRRGNNRIDSLRNMVVDPRVSLLFMIPGVGETMRVNGTAEILTDPELLTRFSMQGKPPRSVIRVNVEKAYFQCQKALARSQLWSPDSIIERSSLPTAGRMQQAVLGNTFDGATYDAEYPDYMKRTMY